MTPPLPSPRHSHALLQLLPVHAIAPHLATFALIQQLLVLTHAVLPQLFARAAVVPDLVVHAYARCSRSFAYVSTTPAVGADTGAPALLAVLTVPPVLADARPTAFLAYVPPPPVLADPFPRTLNAVIPCLGLPCDTIREPLSTAKGRSRDPEKPTPPGTARAPTERAPTEMAPSPMPRRPRSESLASNPIRSSRPNAERARRGPESQSTSKGLRVLERH